MTPGAGARPCGVLECVVNISEGRDQHLIARLAAAAGRALLDVHTDEHHNRSVLTLVGEDAPRAVTRAAVAALDLRRHEGVHPRIGVVDVVPFAPLAGDDAATALGARDRFATWAADELGVPTFLYGPERSLPEVRRGAFTTLRPDHGPATPHPTAGAIAVGARALLVAYNLWLAAPDVALARRLAAAVRGPSVRALGLPVGDRAQVSLNLMDPATTGPAAGYDLVDRAARTAGSRVVGAELVGLLPEAVLRTVDEERWGQLDLAAERTIEARLAAGGWEPEGSGD
jgi:glutamate formiminotransferase